METLVPTSPASQGFDASSSTSSAPQLGSIYVGDLNPDVTEKDLLDVFKTCGTVRSVRIPRDIQTGNSLCYGYVNYDSMEAANKAVSELNGVRIREKRPCRVMHQEHDSSKRNSLEGKIFVKGLRPDVDTRVLQGYMSQYGDIYSCVVKTDADGKSLGYGFCQFQNPEDARKAINDTRDSKPSLGESSSISVFLPPDQRPQGRDKYTNVYIKGFDRFATEEVVKSLFKDCGNVTSWFFAREDDSREDGAEKNLRGFCFANFENHETAISVVQKFSEAEPIVWVDHVPQDAETSKKIIEEHPDKKFPDNMFVGKIFAARAMNKEERKKVLSVDHPRNFPAMDEKRCIFIKGVSQEMTEDDLIAFFSKYGELDTITRGGKQVPSVHIPRSKENGNAIRGIAYVNFKSAEDCAKALNAGDAMVKGKKLAISIALPKEKRMQIGLQVPGVQGMPPMMPMNAAQYQMQMQLMAMALGNPMAFMNAQMMGRVNPADIHQPHSGNSVYFGSANRGFGYNHKNGGNGGRRPQNRSNGNVSRGNRSRNAGDVKERRNAPASQARHKNMAQEPVAPKAGEVTTSAAMPVHPAEPVEVGAPVEAEMSPEDLKQKLGEKIYERVMNMFENDEPRWGKLTGMLIESIEPAELQRIVDDPRKLDDKINEANKFYDEHVNRANAEDQQ